MKTRANISNRKDKLQSITIGFPGLEESVNTSVFNTPSCRKKIIIVTAILLVATATAILPDSTATDILLNSTATVVATAFAATVAATIG